MAKFYDWLSNTALGEKAIRNQRYRILLTANLSLIINGLYALANLTLGFYAHSYWFISAGAYYVILAVMRFSAVMFERRNKCDMSELFLQQFAGIMLIGLSFVLTGSVYLSIKSDVAKSIHEIIMITIATYTFTKITLAIINFIKSKKLNSPLLVTLRNISLSDAAVSIFSMQRSMLVSFDGMTAGDIRLMNMLTGMGVCLVVAVLGISMIYESRKGDRKMAKSKLVKANEKIAEGVTTGFKKISDGVVEGYKSIENAVVEGYTKIEDKFVDAYLTKDGETVEDAKKRLKKEAK